MFFGRHARDPRWYQQIVGVSDADFARLQAELPRAIRNQILVSTRWMTHFALFERELYRTEKGDSQLWYRGVHDIQYLNVPEERLTKPDWAAKYHFSSSPAYYHNYLLGELLASQLYATFLNDVLGANQDAEPSLVAEPRLKGFLIEKVFRHGARYRWDELIKQATGQPLTPEFFAQQFAQTP
jgi:peptidyl-dipeptidase A